MFFVFLLLWILLNGKVTWEVIGLGALVSGVLYAFACKFLGYSLSRDLLWFRKLPYIFAYGMALIWEIVKANMDAIRIGTSYRNEADPVIVRFRTDLKSKVARVVLANSITLTPGTITIALEGDELIVHALDAELAKGIDQSIFVRMLQKMEAMDEEILKKRGKSS